jgi:hypothetical protein
MKRSLVIVIVLFVVMFVNSLPTHATRKEGINGTVGSVDSNTITIANKTYRIGKQFRVVVATREGIHRYERGGRPSDIRVGDKAFAVVLYDEITDIYLERY